MKTIKFYTLGCKVNQYETQEIRERLLDYGFKEIGNGKKAGLYLINTCTVTHRADSDSLSFIRKAKKENKKAKVIVTGCLAELDADRIKEACGESLIVKNKDKDKILKRLYLSDSSRRKGISYFKGHTRAFLKIQDGCNNFCAYCKVPLVRGVSRSKPLKEVIREAEELAKNGFKEIVLSGICLGAYGKDLYPKVSLIDAIEGIEKMEGILRIRLSSIEAGDVTPELISKMRESEKLCRHLHIPIQSGDDRILKKMKRNYNRNTYLALVKSLKKRIPGIAITTDCLVGFPGESEINFGNTLDLIKKILPLKVHIFPYSRREGTAAAGNLKDEISPDIIKERIARFKNIAEQCSYDYRKQFLNKNTNVLMETASCVASGSWEGYSDNYIRVLVKTNLDLKNKFVYVKIKKVNRGFCQGYII